MKCANRAREYERTITKPDKDCVPRPIRGSHEGSEDQSGPSPSACSGYAIAPRRDSTEAVDAAPTASLDGLITRPDRKRPGERSPDFYASTWSATVKVYDVKRQLLIDDEFDTLEQHWGELSKRWRQKMKDVDGTVPY